MYKISDIIEKRNCGDLKLAVSINWDYSLSEILSSFGLSSDESGLKEVSKGTAAEIIKALLYKSLAYDMEIMPEADAAEYAENLIALMAPDDAIFYTNADWHLYHQENSSEYAPFTEATFDGGIIALGEYSVMCFWVEEDD